MKRINKISNLKVGEHYYICFVKDDRLARHCKLLAIINETVKFKDNKLTELYVKQTKGSTNLVYCKEIGIGYTKIEARENFNRFIHEENESFSNSFQEVKESLFNKT